MYLFIGVNHLLFADVSFKKIVLFKFKYIILTFFQDDGSNW